VTSDLFRRLLSAVFSERHVRLAVQLRIEKDWVAHAEGLLKVTVTAPEDYHLSYMDIFRKIDRTLRHASQAIYVVCDEEGLPFPKELIRREVKSEFGFDLIWKSDILPSIRLFSMSALELSLIDFEMALQAEYFVGLTRSTFSNNVSWEKFCRTGADVQTHYIYNKIGDALARRVDNGVFADPGAATAEK
jgi:hypothetical protein